MRAVMILSGLDADSPHLIRSTFFMPAVTLPQIVYWPSSHFARHALSWPGFVSFSIPSRTSNPGPDPKSRLRTPHMRPEIEPRPGPSGNDLVPPGNLSRLGTVLTEVANRWDNRAGFFGSTWARNCPAAVTS